MAISEFSFKDYIEAPNKKDYINMVKACDGNNTLVDAEGGYLIERKIVDEILNSKNELDVFYSEARMIKTSNKNVRISKNIDQYETTTLAGMKAYWVDECDSSIVSNPNYGALDLSLKRMVTYVPVTDELKYDFEALPVELEYQASKRFMYKIQKEMLIGEGAIKGLFYMNDADGVKFITSATPSTIDVTDVLEAVNSIDVTASTKVYCSPKYLHDMANDSDFDRILEFSNGYYYLLGILVVPTSLIQNVTGCDFMVGSFAKYVLATQEMRTKMSESVGFLNDETAYKFTLQIAGNTMGVKGVPAVGDADTGVYDFAIIATEAVVESSSSSSIDSSSSSIDSSSSSKDSSSSSSEEYSSSSSSGV